MKIKYLTALFFLAVLTSCSVQRFLPPGEKLYRGSIVIVKKNPDVKTTSRNLKKQLKLAVTPRANKFLFGSHIKFGGGIKLASPIRKKRKWVYVHF